MFVGSRAVIGSNCQLKYSRPILLSSIRPCHSPSVPLSLSHDAWHFGQAWNQRKKSDWSSLQHKYAGWKHWHRFYSLKKQFESQLHMDRWCVLTDMLGPLSVVLCRCELNQTIGSESNGRRWPWRHCVNITRCCYRKPPAVKIWHCGGDFYSLSLGIKQVMPSN